MKCNKCATSFKYGKRPNQRYLWYRCFKTFKNAVVDTSNVVVPCPTLLTDAFQEFLEGGVELSPMKARGHLTYHSVYDSTFRAPTIQYPKL